MSRRASAPLVALGLATGLTLVAAAPGCTVVCTGDLPDSTPVPVELGVDVDLHAVVDLSLWIGERNYNALAIGEAGTVVIWGHDYSGKGSVPIVDVFEVGDAALRGAWVDDGSWWVVGDGGTLMASHSRGASWDSVDLQTSADIHAITGFAERPIVVGDELVALRTVDGTWAQPAPPPEGWGSLRDVFVDEGVVYAVGLGGVVRSSSDPLGEGVGEWLVEDSGLGEDLLALGRIGNIYDEDPKIVALGASGAMTLRDTQGWTPTPSGVSVDILDLSGDRAIGAGGELYEVASDGLSLVDTIPDARALSRDTYGWSMMYVGIDGSAAAPPPENCY